MNIGKLVERARADNSSAFGEVTDKQATRILRAAFKQVAGQIDTTDEGIVAVKGLGRFVIKSVEIQKDGAKVAKKRIIFRPGDLAKSASAENG